MPPLSDRFHAKVLPADKSHREHTNPRKELEIDKLPDLRVAVSQALDDRGLAKGLRETTGTGLEVLRDFTRRRTGLSPCAQGQLRAFLRREAPHIVEQLALA